MEHDARRFKCWVAIKTGRVLTVTTRKAPVQRLPWQSKATWFARWARGVSAHVWPMSAPLVTAAMIAPAAPTQAATPTPPGVSTAGEDSEDAEVWMLTMTN